MFHLERAGGRGKLWPGARSHRADADLAALFWPLDSRGPPFLSARSARSWRRP